jgi:hypothetical protein
MSGGRADGAGRRRRKSPRGDAKRGDGLPAYLRRSDLRPGPTPANAVHPPTESFDPSNGRSRRERAAGVGEAAE